MHGYTFSHFTNDNPKTALVDGNTQVTYGQVNRQIARCAAGLLTGKADLDEERIAFLMPASVEYVVTLHAVWRAGGIAVPLNTASATPELAHYLNSAGVRRLVTADGQHNDLKELCTSLDVELVTFHDLLADKPGGLPTVTADRRAMIVFTSGTTSKPKGVVTTHKAIARQVTTLIDAWAWSEDDVIPLFLPLHHVHGIINVLSCALWAGAEIHLFPRFELPRITETVAAGSYTVFMAVPTIYVKLIDYLEALDPAAADAICDGFRAMRLNVSGSAACPEQLFHQWQALTGQTLLERYGMTEIGMAISNPYRGERRAGHVGQALPGVLVQLFNDSGEPVHEEKIPGEIRIKGDNVFLEYWNNPEAAAEAFKDGWFCTGDIAIIEEGSYRIMGRASIDIIKSGGYKLSALEIEGVLLTHPCIAEVAVIGIDDDTWGEAVMAVIVLIAGAELDDSDLRAWCHGKMSPYKIPRQLKVVDALPRNAMGKVIKPALKAAL